MNETNRQPSCEERVEAHLESRLDDLRQLWEAYKKDGEGNVEDLGNIYEYGLSFDYVAPETFKQQPEGFFRFQISYGGPSEEFRFFTSPGRGGQVPHRIEFWFLDWFDGAHRIVASTDEENHRLLMELWEWWQEGGAVEKAISDATS